MKAPRGWYAVCAAILSGAGLVIAVDLTQDGGEAAPPFASGPSASAPVVPAVPLPVPSSAAPAARTATAVRPAQAVAAPSPSPSVPTRSPSPSPSPQSGLGVSVAVIVARVAALDMGFALP
jgi:hypothetical protein